MTEHRGPQRKRRLGEEEKEEEEEVKCSVAGGSKDHGETSESKKGLAVEVHKGKAVSSGQRESSFGHKYDSPSEAGRKGRGMMAKKVVTRRSRRLKEQKQKESKNDDSVAVGKEHILPDELYSEIVEQSIDDLWEDLPTEPFVTVATSSSVATEPNVLNVEQAGSSGSSTVPAVFACGKCAKKYATKNGYQKHLLTHAIKDANSRRPTAEDLFPHVESIVIKTLEEIALEFGEEKKAFCKGILSAIGSHSKEWYKFIESFADPFLQSLTNPSTIMPSSQYEEQLRALNYILNNEETYNAIVNGLISCNPEQTHAETPIPGMVAFRLCTKFVDAVVHLVFTKMREMCQVKSDSNNLSTVEKEAFVLHIQKLLQEYYRKGLKLGSKVWLSRCACIRECFFETDSEELTVDMIVKDNLFNEYKLGLSAEVVSFFSQVEQITQTLILEKSTIINSNSVLDVIFKPENFAMLNIWYSLTSSFFSEEESLIFMRDLLSTVVKLSLRLEVGKTLISETDVQQKYALRTDLKRN